MSAVGLTKAMRRALEKWPAISVAMRWKLYFAGFAILGSAGGLTPRGHAALAAPRMTQAELVALEWYANGQTGPLRPHGKTINRLCSQKWYRDGELTPSGLKALNDVRAAMGSELYKDNMP